MIESPPRVVFDCNIALQSLLGPGPANRCFEFVDSRQVQLLISPAIYAEYQDVLSRPKIIKKYPKLTTQRVADFFVLLMKRSTQIDAVPHLVNFPRDPKDEPYLDLAVSQQAKYIVTRDQQHLLSFATENTPEAIAFRQLYPTLEIVDPVTFIRTLDRSIRP